MLTNHSRVDSAMTAPIPTRTLPMYAGPKMVEVVVRRGGSASESRALRAEIEARVLPRKTIP